MRTIFWRVTPGRSLATAAVLLGCLLVLRMVFPGSLRHTPVNTDHTTRSESLVDQLKPGQHRLAVIVPFRNRFEELLEFVPHIHNFLTKKNIPHQIVVVNQADNLRFNRASLINIGYRITEDSCDYLAMHDVDLLPLNAALDYGHPGLHAFHVAAPELHPLYHYKTYVGGILIISHEKFFTANGLSNRYWGWGREDDEFYVRMKEAGIEVHRPNLTIVTTGQKTFQHVHDRKIRKRDGRMTPQQKLSGGKRDRKTGLNTLKYKITEDYNLTIQGAPAHLYNVELDCDRTDTPWCDPL